MTAKELNHTCGPHYTLREGGRVIVGIDGVESLMSEDEFIRFMEAAMNTLQAIVGERRRGAVT